jgi:hypothetical protein
VRQHIETEKDLSDEDGRMPQAMAPKAQFDGDNSVESLNDEMPEAHSISRHTGDHQQSLVQVSTPQAIVNESRNVVPVPRGDSPSLMSGDMFEMEARE